MTANLRLAAASAIALAIALPSGAQPYRETLESERARADYDARRAEYEAKSNEYEAKKSEYDARRENYDEAQRNNSDARREYNRRYSEWARAQAIYDRRYGRGSYARMYARPTWDEGYWSSYSPPPYVGYYGREPAQQRALRCSSSSTVTGGLIGALAGAILGSSVASRGVRTEGAVLGGVVGGVIGGSVGNSRGDDSYKCDRFGPYFTYDDTIPYREGRRRYRSNYDSDYYSGQNCRLAAAPIDSYGRDLRYIRVCPDSYGRFRITG